MRCGENKSQTVTIYQQRHPDRAHPSRQCIQRLYERFLETGCVAEKSRSGRRKSETDQNHTVNILASCLVNKKLSVRERSREAGQTRSSVYKILKVNKIKKIQE